MSKYATTANLHSLFTDYWGQHNIFILVIFIFILLSFPNVQIATYIEINSIKLVPINNNKN